MSRFLINIILLLILILIVGMTWMLKRDYTTRNYEMLPGMVDSVPFDSQSENKNFRNDQTLQSPVIGTIVHDKLPKHYNATPEDAIRAGEELKNPVIKDSAFAFERGTVIFSRFCQPCHGNGALGDGIIAKEGFPPPPSLLTEKVIKMKDGQLFHIMAYGQGNMPSLASQISEIDRWNVIMHIRALQERNITAEGGVK